MRSGKRYICRCNLVANRIGDISKCKACLTTRILNVTNSCSCELFVAILLDHMSGEAMLMGCICKVSSVIVTKSMLIVYISILEFMDGTWMQCVNSWIPSCLYILLYIAFCSR